MSKVYLIFRNPVKKKIWREIHEQPAGFAIKSITDDGVDFMLLHMTKKLSDYWLKKLKEDL